MALSMHSRQFARARATASTRVQSVRSILPPMQACAGTKCASHLLATGLAVSLLLGNPSSSSAAPMHTLADVSRPAFEFIDADRDGFVSQDEIAALTKAVAEENDLNEPRSNLLAFTVRLFDLNQDGKLTTDEVLTGLTLDTAVSEEGTALREDVYKVFDQDGNGKITMAEWKAPWGNLGKNGEELKEWTFDRVEYLSDSTANLNVGELANALTLMRLELLGY